MKKLLLFIFIGLLLVACGSKKQADVDEHDESFAQIEEVKDALDDAEMAIRKYAMDDSYDHYMKLMEYYQWLKDMDIDYDEYPQEMKNELREIQFRSDSLGMVIGKILEKDLQQVRKDVIEKSDYLVEKTETFPVYMQKGSTLYLDFETAGIMTVKVYNADSKSVLKTYAGKKAIKDSITINNSAIYLLELVPKSAQYVELKVSQSVTSLDQLNNNDHSVEVKKVDCGPNDFRAQKVNGIKMTNMFQEPRKITLRSQGKAFFSGSSRSVVTIQIPAGTSDLFYNLRISTNEGDRTADGQFCDNMRKTYREVKFLGLPVYETTGNKSSLIRELLNSNKPVREEEAYCSMYVCSSAAEAKKFQDGKPVSELKYDIDRSAVGTQSCNGCLSVKGLRTLYLCFENERFRYSNYLWLEVIAAVPQTEYFTEKYSVK